jgi:hypothetical protein
MSFSQRLVAGQPWRLLLGVAAASGVACFTPLPVLLLGLSGAMAARSFLPKVPLPRMLVSIVVGTLAAAAATPLVAHYLGLPAGLHLGLAFFTGMFAELALTWAFRRLPEIADRRFGGGE